MIEGSNLSVKSLLLKLMIVLGMTVSLSIISCSELKNDKSSGEEKDPSERTEEPQGLVLKDIEYGQTAIISFHLAKDAKGTVDFSVTGKGSYVGISVLNGEAKVEISDLEPGDYPVVASYSGDGIYPSTVKEGSFTVSRSPVITVITTSTPANGYAYDLNEEIRYRITLSYYRKTPINFKVQDSLTEREWSTGISVGGNYSWETSYIVRETDLNNGKVSNVVSATGISQIQSEAPVEISSPVHNDPTVARSAFLTLSIVADVSINASVGQTITYNVRVLNNGNVTVNNISVRDDHAGSNLPVASLASGEHKDLEYTYVVTQADVDTGSITAVVRANGSSVNGTNPPEATATTTVVAETAVASLSITKTAEIPEYRQEEENVVTVGDVVSYHVVVTNTGNVSVTEGTLEDDRVDLSSRSFNLAPGGNASFDYDYTVTPVDMDSGDTLTNTVTANAIAVRGNNPSEVEASSTVTLEEAYPHLTVEIITDGIVPDGGYDEGDTIQYEVWVTNDGNITINNVVVSVELTGAVFNIGTLASGEQSQSNHTSYTVTEEDLYVGEVRAVATAEGTPVRGGEVFVDPGEDPEPTAPAPEEP